jgi:hypothetical protein
MCMDTSRCVQIPGYSSMRGMRRTVTITVTVCAIWSGGSSPRATHEAHDTPLSLHSYLAFVSASAHAESNGP